MGSEHYCLRWNNHQNNLLGVFSQLLRDESLVDVTLACSEGHSIRAHKVVLSACSSYFQTLFLDHPSRHPIVILKDVRFAELRTLIEFMYKGEVNVEYCQLSALLKTAESLKVKGLAEMTNLGPGRTSSSSSAGGSNVDYAQELEPEQMEPTELVSKRTPLATTTAAGTTSTTATTSEEQQQQRLSASSTPPPSSAVVRMCGRTPERSPSSIEAARSDTPMSEECRPSDMSLMAGGGGGHNGNSATSCSALGGGGGSSSASNRISSPITNEPLPGPSNMPPVQQVPLSLKKEVDWTSSGPSSEDKNIGESSLDYQRQHSHDASAMEMERCFGSSPPLAIERPPSAHSSSRSSTPFTIPSFPSLATSLLEVGLMHPALLGEEMFRCSACMAAFPSIWLLEQHTALQHIGALGSIDKPFVCEQCGQSYRYRSAYVKHREQNHRARLPADKLFSCDVCGMQFRYLKSFKKHRLNHALERLHTGKTTTTTAESTTAGVAVESRLDPNQQRHQHPPHQHTSTCCSSSSANNLRDGSGNNSSMTAMAVATDNNSSDQVSSSNETIGPLDNEEEGTMNDDNNVVHPVDQVVDLVEVKKESLDSSDERKTLPIDEDAEQDDTIDSIGGGVAYSGVGGGACSSSSAVAANSCSDDAAAAAFIRNAAQAEASIISFLRADAVERQRERRFACPFCGKCVRSKENLKLHVRKHTGERPFVCLFCGRAFGGKSDLTRHLRIHTGERPYHCDSCGKCFARADYLSKHLTTHLNSPR